MSSSGVMTDVTNALIRANVTRLTGTIATTPALLITDGLNAAYACDVNIGQYDSSGKINQWKQDNLGIPGTPGFNPTDTLTDGTTLRNVAIATNNAGLIYASIGTSVVMTRSSGGTFKITGLAEAQVGTYTLIPIDVGNHTIGLIQNFNTVVRALTLAELALYDGGFGFIPLGAIGTFVNGTLNRISI